MYIAPDGSLGIGDPDAITFASHGITSVARNIPNGPSLRGTLPKAVDELRALDDARGLG